MFQPRSLRLAVFVTISWAINGLHFISPSSPRIGPWRNARRQPTVLTLSMLLDDNLLTTLSWKSPFLESIDLALPSLVVPLRFASAFPTALDLASNPLIAAEIYSDAAHLVLDFSCFFGPATVVVRLAAVIGRILTIASDYVPDHSMFPEEFVIQLCMLALSVTLLIKSLLPLAMSSSIKLSFQDRRTYCVLFGPAGVNWNQYKTLATIALEWLTIEPSHAVDSDSTFIYWLYSGEVIVLSCNGKEVYSASRVKRALNTANAASGLWGESTFIHSLETTNFAPNETNSTMTIKAGPDGAKLLRIDTIKLAFLMEHDEKLAQSIRILLVKSMHDKLSSFLSG